MWPRHIGDHLARDDRTIDDTRGREASQWQVQHEHSDMASRRPRAPSRRMSACHMPRHTFLAVAFGWAFVVVALLTVILALRWFG